MNDKHRPSHPIAPSRRRWLAGCSSAAVASLACPSLSWAQTAYPNRPLRLVVPFAAGGSDSVARAFAERLGPLLKQQVYVDNRPGAQAVIGSENVANAPADGYSMLFLGGGSLTPVLIKDLRFDIQRQLKPVICLARGGMTMMTNAQVPANNLREFVDYARRNKGKVNYSHTAGSIALSSEMLKAKAGFDATAIPYKGASQVLSALITNEVQMTIDVAFNYLGMIKEGKVKPIVHGGQERSPSLPDVPTLAESGIPDLIFAVSYGIWVAAGTPDPLVAQLNAAFNETLKDPDIRQRLTQASVVPVGGAPHVHADQIALEQDMWARAAKQIGYRPE